MPNEQYSYHVVIGVDVDSQGARAGTRDLESEMTRWEKRAVKSIERIQKAMDNLAKTGFDPAKMSRSTAQMIQQQEKITRSIIETENKKVQASEKTRREVLRNQQLIDREHQRSHQSQQKAAQQTAVLNERLTQQQLRTQQMIARETDRVARERQRTIQAEIRAQQTLDRERERSANAEIRRQQQLNRAQNQRTRDRVNGARMIGNGAAGAGVAATAAVTAPIVAGFASVLTIGLEYEKSMNMFAAVTQATAGEMEKAAKVAIALGNDLSLPGVSAKDAAAAMTELGKAGLNAAQAMDAAKGTLQLAVAGGMDAAQAAEITANALNTFSLEAKEAGRVADLLAAAANASSAEVQDVAASLQQAGAVFAGAKVPIEDVVALIGELANKGIKGSDAGTSLKTMMQRLQSPTDNARAVMEKLGVAVFDSEGKMKSMRDIIGQFEGGLKGLSEEQKAQALNTIFGSDAVRAAIIVFGDGQAAFDKMKEAVMRTNAAQELAAARTKGLGGAWEALKSQAETLGLVIFNRIKEPLTEVVIAIATVFGKVTDIFTNLPAPVQQAIVVITALVAAIGPLLAAGGAIIIVVSSVVEGLLALTGAATVGAALASLLPIIAGVVAVIAALVAGVVAAAGVMKVLWDAWDQGWGAIASIVAIAGGAILSAVSPIIGLPVLIGAAIVTLYKVWQTNFGGIRDFTVLVWNKIVEVVGGAMEYVYDIINVIVNKILVWWKATMPQLTAITGEMSAGIQHKIQTLLAWITDFWGRWGGTITAVVRTIWGAITGLIKLATDNVLDIITFFIQIFRGNWQGAWETFLKIVKRYADLNVAVIKWLVNSIIDLVKWIGNWLYNNFGAIMRALGGIIWEGIKALFELFKRLPGMLLSLIPRLYAAGRDIGTAIWTGIKNVFSENQGTLSVGDLRQQDDQKTFDIRSLWQQDPNDPKFKLMNQATTLGLKTENDWLGNKSIQVNNALMKNPAIADFVTSAKAAGLTVVNLDEAAKKTTSSLDKMATSVDKVKSANFGSVDSIKEADKKKAKEASSTMTIQQADLGTLLSAMRIGTMQQESGGRSRVQNTRTKATGLFQVMPANVPEWTRNTPGVGQMTVEQFRNNPEAQIKVFNLYMGRYLATALKMAKGNKEVAVRMAAAAWYGGPDNMKDYAANFGGKGDEPTFNQYTAKVLARTKRGLGKVKGGKTGDYDAMSSLEVPKTPWELADEQIMQNAQQRLQKLVLLSRELNVELTSPIVASTQAEIAAGQEKELRILEELQRKRQQIALLIDQMGVSEQDYQSTNLQIATESLTKLQSLADAQGLVNSTYDDGVQRLAAMKAATGETLTPLEEFNLKMEQLREKTGLSKEEFERLNPKLAQTRDLLNQIFQTDKDNKFREQMNKFTADMTQEIQKIEREARAAGMTEDQRRDFERANEADDYIRNNKIPVTPFGLGSDYVREMFRRRNAAQDQLRAAEKSQEQTKLFADTLKEMNERLRENTDLTETQRFELELTTGSLKDLTEEQKNQLRLTQQQLEMKSKIDAYNDFVKQAGMDFGGIFADSFMALFEKGVKGALDTLGQGVKSFFKNLFLNVMNQLATGLQNKIADQFLKVFGIGKNNGAGGASGNGAGGGIMSLFNRGGGGGGASSGSSGGVSLSTTSTSFVNNPAVRAGGSAPQQAMQMLQNIPGLDLPTLTQNATPTPLGGAMRQISSGLPMTLAHEIAHGSAGPKGAGAGKMSIGNIFGKGGIFGDKGFGFNSGTISTVGMIGGMAGSMIGGPVGNIMMGAASGIGMMSSLASMLGISSLGGPVGLAVGAAIGGIMALGQVLFGRNKQRRADEKTRNQAMLDSFAAIDKLIADVSSDKIDGAQALSQADEIRKNYLDAMGQLKDSKARRHALADVSRIDAKINILKGAVKSQEGRQANLARLTPTFGDGGSTSQFIGGNYRVNPLGYVSGPGGPKSDSIMARISNREYVLDAKTTSNIGVNRLDAIRRNQGKNLGNILFAEIDETPRFADGGSLMNNSIVGSGVSQPGSGTGEIKVYNTVNVFENEDGSFTATTDTWIDTPQGKKKIEATVEEVIYRNGRDGAIPKALRRAEGGS